jgi:putative heme d1 biosynthesis radical SAM protein NirJ2
MIISWNVTNECNLYCAHCYRDAGAASADELTTGEGRALIEEIARAGFKILIFSGGEPLLREDIFELVDYARRQGLRPVFGSNGTLIDPAMAQKLRSAGVGGVGISLDSTDRGQHDRFRGTPGAWDGALRGMASCRQAGVPFQVHTTVMDWNSREVEALTDLAVTLGAVAHHLFFLVPTGRAVRIEGESLKAEQYEGLLHRILAKQQQVPIELKPTCAPQFMRIAREMGLTLRFQRGCLAGTAYCLINPWGDVQPCAYLDIPVGNVRETPFSQLWQASDVFQRLRTLDYTGGCGRCGYRQVCGGCRARAFYYYKDYMAEEPWCLYRQQQEQKNGCS